MGFKKGLHSFFQEKLASMEKTCRISTVPDAEEFMPRGIQPLPGILQKKAIPPGKSRSVECESNRPPFLPNPSKGKGSHGSTPNSKPRIHSGLFHICFGFGHSFMMKKTVDFGKGPITEKQMRSPQFLDALLSLDPSHLTLLAQSPVSFTRTVCWGRALAEVSCTDLDQAIAIADAAMGMGFDINAAARSQVKGSVGSGRSLFQHAVCHGESPFVRHLLLAGGDPWKKTREVDEKGKLGPALDAFEMLGQAIAAGSFLERSRLEDVVFLLAQWPRQGHAPAKDLGTPSEACFSHAAQVQDRDPSADGVPNMGIRMRP